MDICNYSKEYHLLMENNRTKRLSSKKPLYYHDIINYIKNQNNDITKTKIETNYLSKNNPRRK